VAHQVEAALQVEVQVAPVVHQVEAALRVEAVLQVAVQVDLVVPVVLQKAVVHPAEAVLQVAAQVVPVHPVALQKAVVHPVEAVLQVEAVHQNAADLQEVRKSAVAHPADSQICVDFVLTKFCLPFSKF